jgi:hypothetical protein
MSVISFVNISNQMRYPTALFCPIVFIYTYEHFPPQTSILFFELRTFIYELMKIDVVKLRTINFHQNAKNGEYSDQSKSDFSK